MFPLADAGPAIGQGAEGITYYALTEVPIHGLA